VSDEGSDSTISTPFRYHLELTPAQLKIVHTALRSLLDDFGHDQSEIQRLIHELLAKLPDEHAIRAIQLDVELDRSETEPSRPSDDGPPPSAA
jgi:ATP-dependent exoDNAse (exonuclease V) beta subunit